MWNRATKKVKLYSCNKFTDSTSFDKAINQGTTVKGETFKLRVYLERVQLNDLADDDWLDEARKLREEGKSLKETAEILKSKGIKTSKSSLDRKLKE